MLWCFRTSYISTGHTESGGRQKGRMMANSVLLQVRIMIAIYLLEVGFQPLFLFLFHGYASTCHAYLRSARRPRGTGPGSRRHTEDARLRHTALIAAQYVREEQKTRREEGLHGPLCNIKSQPHTLGFEKRRRERERRAAPPSRYGMHEIIGKAGQQQASRQAMLVVA